MPSLISRSKAAAQRLSDAVLYSRYANRVADHRAVDKGTQILLSLRYQEMLQAGRPLPPLSEVGFRVYSQTDEDGLLLFLFSLLGTTNKKTVEVCAGEGIECNSANLILNHGWEGLLFDGDAESIRRGRAWYARSRSVWMWPPRLVQAWIETKNINALITAQGFAGEIDLLSVDMDGMDYWAWEAIECVTPRVVVAECQVAWGDEKAVTVPYQADFDRRKLHPEYYGASLPALVALGRRKGYRLVGSNSYGFNAIFLRDGVGEDLFPEVAAADCLRHPWAVHARQTHLEAIRSLPWVEVAP